MEDDIDIEEHDLLNDPALRSVFPDLAIVKHEIIDFDIISEETNENVKDSHSEVNSWNIPVVCSAQDVDVKPDILHTDIDAIITLNSNASRTEKSGFRIKKEAEDFVSNNCCMPVADSLIVSNERRCHSDVVKVERSEEIDKRYGTSDTHDIFYKKEIRNNNPHISTGMISVQVKGERITKQCNEMKEALKVVLTDCYTSLLKNNCYCAQCAVLFPTTEAYSEHYTSTHTETTNSTKASASLVVRKRSKTFEYNISKKKIEDQTNLNTKPFECDICQKAFRHSNNLDRHMKLVHTLEKQFKCDKCEKTFTLEERLKSHYLLHTGEKPFECKTCKKKFTLMSYLNRHSQVHMDIKRFECKTCKKRFRESRDLHLHEFIHTGVKPYQCKTCKKGFSQMGNLYKHNLIHTDVKPFACATCARVFRYSHHLKRHNCKG